jgi:hypothetical protein
MQFAQGGDMLVDAECNAERTIPKKPEQRILRPRETGEQMHCFGQHRLTHKKGRVQLFDSRNYPRMILFRSIEKSDVRSRINDCGAHRGQNQ